MSKDKDYFSINTLEEFNDLISVEEGILVYFSHEACNVCKILKPKVAKLINDNFPKLNMVYADTVKTPEIAGQNGVFAVPSILVFIGGREYIRASRNISIDQLEKQISRPYGMMFSD